MQDEKACFTKIESQTLAHNYTVVFQDCQDLQLLRKKILRTSTVLNSVMAVILACKAHCRHLMEAKATWHGGEALIELAVCEKQLRWHQQEVSRLLQYSLGTFKLVSSAPFWNQRSQLLSGDKYAG